jgi:CubicO group peptidase (beta-lactamase class C family)
MQRITSIFVLLLALSFVPTLAQDTNLYEDPAGRFSVPVPTDWMDESTTEAGRFVNRDGVVLSILAIEAADATSGDQAVLAMLMPDLIGTDPAQTYVSPLPNGTWTQLVYVPAPDRFAVLMTQWLDSVTYALLFDTPGQDAFVANQGQIDSILVGFSVGVSLDLTGVEPLSFTAEMLAELEAYIEDASAHFHIPGAAIAIVQNGEVVFTGGFGTTEGDGGEAVTSETLFMIGSSTKPMTTMMIGTLVDEGLLDWNQSVTDILPTFALSNPAAAAQIRVRDLVNMSSGVPAYDAILSVANLTPQELIISLTEIPLVAAPGEMYNYSNQMFAVGGYISALAAGAPMDALYEGYVDLVQERVFDPIGMPDTTFDFDAAVASPNHALPYAYDPVTQEYIPVPLDSERFVGPIAPAGAVWSNADDMARFLLTVSNNGVSPDGEQVLSAETLRAMQSPEIAPAGPFDSYGIGWIIESYNGVPLVWHGGNIKGFTSDLAFLPDADLGIVTLTNVADANDFRNSVRQYVFELAFGLGHDASMSFAAAYEGHEAQMRAASEMAAAQTVTAVDSQTVAPYLGLYEYGVTLEMRGSELWVMGAFAQMPLYPATESDDYTGVGMHSAIRVRFADADQQLKLEITYPENPLLVLDKVE